MRAFLFISLIHLLGSFGLAAQKPAFPRLSFPVSQNGNMLEYPFAGGLNAPQLSAADLNEDGILDLVIFDRAGDVFLTFLNEGTANQVSYRYAPEYADNFPVLFDYALLRDYDQDGAADIFCASLAVSSQEVQVFKGYFDNKKLKFKPLRFYYTGCATCDSNLIYYPSVIPGKWNNLFIADTDLPDFDDIDGDGDIDILTFDAAAGGHVWLYENMSVEMGYGLDSLKFVLTDRCWGRFYETGLLACYCDLAPAPDSCVFGIGPPPEDRDGKRHPGSTVMTYDQDGDGDKEIVLGDISFTCLNMLTNGGSPDQAWMSAQDTAFPLYDTPVDILIFPSSFYLDLNNDGKNDMVAAPNNKFTNEDRQGVWYYQNTATTGHTFELQTKRAFTGEMIDVGTAAHPTLIDVDADGLLDLVVSNYGYYTPGNAQNASLYLYRNTGTGTEPKFTLEDADWLDLSELTPNDFDFYPAFGDLDNDGDADMLVGSNSGALYYYRNTAGAGKPMQFQRDFNVMWVTLDVGSYSTPVIADLDSDGLLDILMGERNGNLNFFRNIGAADNPVFDPTPTFTKLGGVDTRVPPSDIGFSAPALVTLQNGAFLLVTGTQEGQLEAYTNVVASESPYAVVSEHFGQIDDGNRSSPAFGDLDGDCLLEMVVGNLRGGLTMYKTDLMVCTALAEAPATPRLDLSPNPARQWVRVDYPAGLGSVQWEAFDLLGRRIARGEATGGPFTIPVAHWAPGLYFLDLQSGGRRVGRGALSVVR